MTPSLCFSAIHMEKRFPLLLELTLTSGAALHGDCSRGARTFSRYGLPQLCNQRLGSEEFRRTDRLMSALLSLSLLSLRPKALQCRASASVSSSIDTRSNFGPSSLRTATFLTG